MSKDPIAPELPTIDMQALDAVTGGVTAAATDPNSQVESMLQDLMSSIQSLAQGQQSSDGGMSQMLPMMMMMMGQKSSAPAPAPPPVVLPPGWERVS
jgi:hypothetical protein